MGWAQNRGDPGQDYTRGGPDEGAKDLRKSVTAWKQKMPFRRRKQAEEEGDKGARTSQKGSWREVCVYVCMCFKFTSNSICDKLIGWENFINSDKELFTKGKSLSTSKEDVRETKLESWTFQGWPM